MALIPSRSLWLLALMVEVIESWVEKCPIESKAVLYPTHWERKLYETNKVATLCLLNFRGKNRALGVKDLNWAASWKLE